MFNDLLRIYDRDLRRKYHKLCLSLVLRVKVLNYPLLILVRIEDDGLWILGYSKIYLLRMY